MQRPVRNLARHLPVVALVIAAATATSSVDAGTDHHQHRASTTTDDAVDIRPSSAGIRSFSDSPHGRLTEQFGPTSGEHVDLINATSWHAAGIDGTGTTIGVIDFFDVDRYWNESEHGPRPVAHATAACFDNGGDCTDEFFDGLDLGGEDHGVAVVETILDTAPGAKLLIGQAVTIDDYRLLVDWFIERDVDVISRSLGSRYDGPGDGRGPLDDLVDHAVEHGVLWVNSAGNNGRNKYYRHPVRLVDDRVAFGPSGDDTFLRFTGCVTLGGIRWANDWDTPPSDRTDYDAFLWESPTGDPASGTVVASSRRSQHLGATPIENIPASRCPASGSSLYLEMRWEGGDITGDVLEILDHGSGIASFTSAEGSAAVSVVDSSNPGVVAVGAVDPATGEEVARYSSRGPSNDGRVLPDLVAPANLTNSVHGRFVGTSAAAAVVTGASALVLSAGLAAGPASAGDLIRHFTIDRGEPGPDNEYGHGEFRLPAPPTGTADSAPSKYVGLEAPVRALDSRPESAAGPSQLIGRLTRGQILELPMKGSNGVPASGVSAVAVNVVSVEADRPSYLQLLPTNAAMVGGYSNINIDSGGQTRSNFAIIPLGPDGSISIYTIADGHVVVDVLGWFAATDGDVTGGRFVELETPERTLDTRRDAPVTPLASGEIINAALPAAVEAEHIEALVVTVTAANPSSPGWLQAFPTGRSDVIAKTSTVNTSVGGAVANTAIVPTDGNGISITGYFGPNGSSDAIVDVIGYITSASAPKSRSGLYTSVTPARAYDSRKIGIQMADGQAVSIDASSALGVSVPSTASGVVWNAAIVAATRPGFARVWATGAIEPDTSALNWSTIGEVRATSNFSAVEQGRATFRVEDGDADLPTPIGDLIVDVFGYFS